MNNVWNEPWSADEAVTRFCAETSIFCNSENNRLIARKVLATTLRACFFESSTMTRDARMPEKVFGELLRITDHMKTLRLTDATLMLPVLWLRLIRECETTVSSDGVNEFLRGLDQDPRVCLMLYQYKRPVSGKIGGPLCRPVGYRELRGYTVDKLLVTEKKDMPGWPYSEEWRVKTYFPEVERIIPLAGKPITATKPRMHGPPLKEVEESRRLAIVKPKKKRSLSKLVRACGSGLISALAACLATEFSRGRSVLEANGRNRRPYHCQMSLDELVASLQKRYKKQLPYAKSTLKSALPRFVSCPRGRPGGKIPN